MRNMKQMSNPNSLLTQAQEQMKKGLEKGLLRMHYIFVCSIQPVAEGDVPVLRAFAWEW